MDETLRLAASRRGHGQPSRGHPSISGPPRCSAAIHLPPPPKAHPFTISSSHVVGFTGTMCTREPSPSKSSRW
ncbi:Hypothetical protein A7982_04278 [Minicystis rosea]|nr:Hypothetical protein A7982_04278 [Minicystis rosea]